LGVYVVAIMVTVVRSWRRQNDDALANQTANRRWVTPVAAAAFIIGIGLALLSIESRPSRQTRPSNEAALAPLPAVPPIELAALGYLPPDTNVVAGFHVAYALRNPLGQDLLLRSSLKVGDVGFDSLERWTGMKFPQIDHVVLGIKLDDQLPPRSILVVRAIAPIDQNEIRRALGRTSSQRRNGRDIFGFTLERPRFDAFGWFADDRTLIVTLTAKDMDIVPQPSTEKGARLMPEVQAYLRERARSADVWAVGHVLDWNRTPLHLLSSTELRNDWAVISKVHTLGAWFDLGENVTFHADFHCADVGAAQALMTYLSEKERTARQDVSKFLPDFDGSPLVQSLKRSAVTTQDGSWVRVEATTKQD
jgi:hypothetical protein